MCYNTKQTSRVTELEARFKVKLKETSRPVTSERFVGFSFPETPVVSSNDKSAISMYQWGLIPPWSKDDGIQKFTLNAKIETLDEKPSFRDSLQKRCLVLVNGFYEWKWLDEKGKRKLQYEITAENDEPFAMAGIWSEWQDPVTKDKRNTYSIITTEADLFMSEIHNSAKRMPVILPNQLEMEWLNGAPHLDFVKKSIRLKAKPLHTQMELF
ncbi:SOS response associated peptidase (SRAP) [Spirosomataceae bacterium TFI 002]|nr:SOS response associated peptidase (SRAP) [Spirosomataceae bacterium TFI 002]